MTDSIEIFQSEDGQLERDSVCAKFARTAEDGKTYQTQHYNLDLIISVGYRVKSQRGVQFRQGATRTLKQQLINDNTLVEHFILLKADS